MPWDKSVEMEPRVSKNRYCLMSLHILTMHYTVWTNAITNHEMKKHLCSLVRICIGRDILCILTAMRLL